jgi:hypothetical protein
MTMEELKASVLRGCAHCGQAWGVMSVAAPEGVASPGELTSAIDAEIDSILLALAGNLALRRDARFIAQAKRVLHDNAALAVRGALEQANVTLH